MTNFEKYKDEILSLQKQYQNKAAPALKNGKIVNCNQIHCRDCDLNNNEVYCNYTFIRWLYEEADSNNKESEPKEVNKEVNNDNTKSCKDCRHTYKKENEEPCVSCRNRYILKFEPKLKPCPYCGGKAKEEEIGREYNIMCEDCRSSTRMYLTPKAAMEAWNRRV